METEGEVIWLDALIDGKKRGDEQSRGERDWVEEEEGDCRSECKVGIN